MIKHSSRPSFPKTRPVQKAAAKPVGDLAGTVLAPVIEKRVGLQSNLKLAWTDIVGEEVASYAQVLRFDWPQRSSDDEPFKPATLVVACEPHRALYFQHDTANLLERINLFLGFHAVDRILIVQRSVEALLKVEPQAKNQRTEPSSLTETELLEVNQTLSDLPDGPLKSALMKLGKAVKASSTN